MSARDVALIELDRKRLPGWPVGLVRTDRGHRGEGPPRHDPRDRALAEQIVIGVVKNHLHLRYLLEHYSGRALKSIDPLAQKIISIGLYQLRFLTRIPASAAVNEAVEQAKRFGRARAAGFVNAVLRKAGRDDPPALPGREQDPAGYAELALSQPRGLFEKLAGLVGAETALAICEHNNRPPPTIVRLYAGESDADLRAAGVEVAPHEREGMYVVEKGAGLAEALAAWAEAQVAQVQDPTAAGVVPRLEIRPGQRLLDRCCGLGTKTLQMRDALGDKGQILAMDPSEQRTEVLQELVRRRGIENIIVAKAGMMREVDESAGGAAGALFDGILVDAPCSNSGVLARRAEARYFQDAQSLASLARLQDRILDDTAPIPRPGGRLAYSTCSIWPEENEERVTAFLQRHPEYQLLGQQTTLPSVDPAAERYHDGGYYAVLMHMSP